MESNQLLEMDRLAATPYVDYPSTPTWYPALIGGYWTAVTGGLLALHAGHPLWMAAIIVIALAVLMAFKRSYRERWGTWPLMGNAPSEIKRAYAASLIGLLPCVVVTGLAFVFAPWYVTLAVGFISFTSLYWLYERRIYPAAVAQVKERLG